MLYILLVLIIILIIVCYRKLRNVAENNFADIHNMILGIERKLEKVFPDSDIENDY